MVSVTDIKRASASDATALDVHEMLYLLSRIRIQDIMSKKPITVPPDLTIEEQLQKDFPHESIGVLRNLAGAFQFSGDEAEKSDNFREWGHEDSI